MGMCAGLKAQPSDRSVLSPHICNCWCTQWAELYIRRPTGNFMWMMRIENEQDLTAMFPDFAVNDISNLFMTITTDKPEDVVQQTPLADAAVAGNISCTVLCSVSEWHDIHW